MGDEVKRVKKPPVLFEGTQEILCKVEKVLDSPLLVYWNSTRGSVCDNDVSALYEVMQRIGGKERFALFIKSNGGSGQAALRIVNLLRRYTKRLTALIPLECASAATMIAIGADDISMGPLAHLTAVDTSITHSLSPVDKDNRRVSVSLDELNRTVKLWKEETTKTDKNPYEALFQYVHPLVIGAIDRSESLSIRICEEILSYHIEETETIRQISNQLNSNYPSHDYPITLREARRIGLETNALDPQTNSLLLEMNKLYSEMGQDAITDYDEHNYHTNTILNIIEGNNIQVFYQNDVDWHYLKEERRWRSTNDDSTWQIIGKVKGKVVKSRLHIN